MQERVGNEAESAFVDKLMRVTAGNPLFLDGAIRMLLAEHKAAHAERLSARDFTIPDGIREAIRRRLTFFSKEANAVLAIAAVAGQEFEFECLRKITGDTAESVVEALNETRRDGLVHSVWAGNLRYRFAHDLIRETIYQDVPAANRLQIHRHVAETLEDIHRADLTPHVAELADHFREALPLGDSAKAIDYSIRAGEAALEVFDYEEATNHWRADLSVMEQYDIDNARHADHLRRLGVLTRDTIDYSEGVSLLEGALRLCKQVGDDHLTALAHLELGSA